MESLLRQAFDGYGNGAQNGISQITYISKDIIMSGEKETTWLK
jgi:hypothetical protein|uniref:Uncharacterized protein n=1 Tax=Eubacterium cellulosolvens (strain ATCC 43171 / JCM 9499 / 6) TaxID=633697 RepID=I5AT01_EUBC6